MNEVFYLRSYLENFMKILSANGYKCFIYSPKGHSFGVYGDVVTPSDNVIHITYDSYKYGWVFAFKYKPSAQHGSGCQCLDRALPNLSLELIQLAESEGEKFAKSLGAKLYKSSKEYFNNPLYRKEDYRQIS